MDLLLRDARIGLRLLRTNAGFTAVAVLTLALGIAATTAIFSVVYATFLEPLPYRDADRLVMVWSQRQQGNRSEAGPADFVEWRRQATAFESLNAWNGSRVAFSTGAGEGAEEITAGRATPGFLPMLGYGHPLALGRDFLEEESTPGRHRVVILTHRLWRDRFGGDPHILGREVRLDREPFTVVGVLAAGPADTNQNQVWTPTAFTAEDLTNNFRWLLVMGRLKPGVTVEQANANMAAVARNLTWLRPDAASWRVSVEPFRNNFLSRDTQRGLWLLLGAVGFVLLIACANVANLLLARGAVRQRELAVRAALGASRGQIATQLLVESVVLAGMGGLLGVALAYGLIQAVIALMPPFMLPTEANIRLNVPVLLVNLAVCVLSGIVFGAAPAWQAARVDVNSTLKDGSRAVSAGGHRLRHGLVVVEFALALTLLAGGGVAVQSLFALSQRDLGFRSEGVLTFLLPGSADRLKTPEQRRAFYQPFLERVEALPGVRSATISTGMPISGSWLRRQFWIEGAIVEPTRRPETAFDAASPGYFETFGIPITRGRGFTARDAAGAPLVTMVNETFVRRHLEGRDPLTQRIVAEVRTPGSPTPTTLVHQIVGVYADVRDIDPSDETQPAMIVPFAQSPTSWGRVAVRTAGEPTALRGAIAEIVRTIDPELPMARVQTLDQVVAGAMVTDRFNTALFGSFAGVGLLLAAFGIYGVMSFVVTQRRQEIGLRMALGADRRDVVGLVVRQGMATAVVGAVVGSWSAIYMARAMRGLVSGVGALDATPFLLVTMTLLASALVACAVPALRAASIDPTTALRR